MTFDCLRTRLRPHAARLLLLALLSLVALSLLLTAWKQSLFYAPQTAYAAEIGPETAVAAASLSDKAPGDAYLPVISFGNVYYVSRLGSNANGRSWATAWNELDQIDWNVVQPGSLILLDGGNTQMVYTTPLVLARSGSSSQPITIALSRQTGRSGKAIIFGGRTTPLPYCGQRSYSYQTNGVSTAGLIVDGASWVVVDGIRWGGIAIHGHNGRGVRFTGDASHVTLRNLEIFDNGIASQNSEGEWRPNMPGIGLAGTNISLERMLIHDNGQDAIQSMSGDNSIADFTLSRSWLYNSRQHPTTNEAFNHCRHPDGIQIYDGGVVSGVTIDSSVIGPGFTQGVILGQTDNDEGSQATVNDVTIRDTLFTKAKGINIAGYPDLKSRNWVIDHVTSYCLEGYTGVCLWLEGTNHTVTNSIFSGSQLVLPDGLATSSGNCQWRSEGFELGLEADPRFTAVNKTDPFSLDDYALLPGSPCAGKGSGITSVDQLMGNGEP